MTINTLSVPLATMPAPLVSRTVAVIGAGAAGLVTARELLREGHKVTVYERENQLGGTWVYTPDTEPDPLGLDPSRPIVHSSLYASLRTNLPREVMGFMDYPFVAVNKQGRDSRRFPGHQEVLDYLLQFADWFGLDELVRYGTEVCHVALDEDEKWVVKSKKIDYTNNSADLDEDEDVYDAVVVCNGHYTEPRIAEIPGIESWPGKQIHSHNYRVPDPFLDQVVLLIGSAASAVDISRDIATVAKEVHVASRSVEDVTFGKVPGYDNMWHHPMIERTNVDGAVVFEDKNVVYADIILHCTGYKFHFPFLDTRGIVTVDDNRVGPLYKHIFPPTLAPWLSFVGLPWKVIPFPLCELQSKWIAGILSGRFSLPSPKEMMADIEALYSSMEASGFPKRYTHNMAAYQFEYDNWLAGQCGHQLIEEWRKKMYSVTSSRKRREPETYRDHWEDEDLIMEAHEYFLKNFPEISSVTSS